MNHRDNAPQVDRFENEEDWLDQYDDDPIDPRHETTDDRSEATMLDELGLDWTDMDRRAKLEIDLEHVDADEDSSEEEIAA